MPERGPDDATGRRGRSRRRTKRRSWARRRHLGLLTTGVALLVLVVGVLVVVATWDSGRESFSGQIAAAASSASIAAPTVAAPSATPTPSATAAAPGAGTVSTVRGAITTVGADRWTVAGANGLDYTVVVTADTRYGGKRTFGSYEVGDTVAVKGTLDQGTVTAQTVNPANPAS